jgi:hypothetical protein
MAAIKRGRRAGVLLAWSLASQLIAACAAPPEVILPENAVVPTGPLEERRVETAEPAATTTSVPTEVAKVAPPPPLILPALRELIGKNQDEVAALLGKPVLVRHDEPAHLFQYRSNECALDVFLYREGVGYTVAYTEVRGANSAFINEADCVRAVLKAKPSARIVR